MKRLLPDEGGLLTEKGILEACIGASIPPSVDYEIETLVAQAQHAEDLTLLQQRVEEARKQERERVLAEIEEKFMLQPNCFSRELHTEGTVIIHKVAWQALSDNKEGE